MNNESRRKALQLVLRVFGVIFLFVYPIGLHMAIRMGLVRRHGRLLPADDCRNLRRPWRLPDHCGEKSGSSSKLDLIHGLVELCPRNDHGRSGTWRSTRGRAPDGRRTGVGARCRRALVLLQRNGQIADGSQHSTSMTRWAIGVHASGFGPHAYSAVAGSMRVVTMEILLAGNPPSSACRRISDSSAAWYTQ